VILKVAIARMEQMEGDFIFIEDSAVGVMMIYLNVRIGPPGVKLCTFHLEAVHILSSTYSSFCFL